MDQERTGTSRQGKNARGERIGDSAPRSTGSNAARGDSVAFTPTTPKEKAIARNAERAGSIYQGEREGLHAFKELETNGNFSIRTDELSPEAIQQKADAVRESFRGKQEVTPDNLAQWLKDQGFTDEEGKPKSSPVAGNR